jgi:hypothetical protein
MDGYTAWLIIIQPCKREIFAVRMALPWKWNMKTISQLVIQLKLKLLLVSYTGKLSSTLDLENVDSGALKGTMHF